MIKFFGKFMAAFRGKGSAYVFHPSDKCSECGTPLMQVEESWRCGNPDCSEKVRARVEHWCSPGAMDIPGGDAALVATLVSRGLVRDVGDLYRLKLRELAALPGMSPDSAQSFFDGITASRKRDAWRVLFGLSIPGVDAGVARSLGCQFPSVDHVFGAGEKQLMKAKTIDETIARGIVQWHGDPVNRRMMDRLNKAVNFKSELYEPGRSNAKG